jgi:hypothetical protein
LFPGIRLEEEATVSFSLIVLSVLVAVGVLSWIPIRGWFRRSEALRLEPTRAMSGDADLLTPDYESTLTIAIDAQPADVWPRLLEMGRGRASQLPSKTPDQLQVGDILRFRYAPAFPIRAIDPGRTLVLGDASEGLQWRWQFELYAVDQRRTRLLSRTRICSGRTLGSSLLALALRPVTFVITRKMIFDVKRRAERMAGDSAHPLHAAS